MRVIDILRNVELGQEVILKITKTIGNEIRTERLVLYGLKSDLGTEQREISESDTLYNLPVSMFCDCLGVKMVSVDLIPSKKTFKDKFYEAFPNAPKNEDGIPLCCVESAGFASSEDCCLDCKKCWNRPYEGE